MRNCSLSKLAFMATAPRKPATTLAPRKLPRQARSAATVQAILEAAAHILDSEGMAACTTNAVALKAGVSIGSLYQYFPARRDHQGADSGEDQRAARGSPSD
jgi:AcrR family transcriptional regulator